MAETPTRRIVPAEGEGSMAPVWSADAGTFSWFIDSNGLRWLHLKLPEPAGFIRLPVHREGETDPRRETTATWQWNGDEDRPTLTPSIHTFIPESQDGARPRQELWHGFLTDGVLRSC